ncbi:hypothetical protein EDD22DRAFT_953379 [Suillus occidentalis]|nr:hypothetical protein EDD22DRAFT_953379 [Suillus occidentalis]
MLDQFVRPNELMELFGSDLSVENGSPGEFAWKDAEFLTAMQEGHWVLLDEMNLYPKLFSRGVMLFRTTEVLYTFPSSEDPSGGGRKELPKFFLDRFTKVYIEELSSKDFLVCRERFKGCDEDMLRAVITYNNCLNQVVVHRRTFGRNGSPWEFNLRDILHWGALLQPSPISHRPRDFLRVIYFSGPTILHNPHPVISSSRFRVGPYLERRNNILSVRPRYLLQAHFTPLDAIGACLPRPWSVIITGRHDNRNILHEIIITNSTDTMDILGGFEQMDHRTLVLALVQDIISLATVVPNACLTVLLPITKPVFRFF